MEGAPSSEKTDVRMVFTKDTLYIGAVMYDAEPAGIVTADARRDASLDDVDSFRIIFDTYRDRQNGFVFDTSAAGAVARLEHVIRPFSCLLASAALHLIARLLLRELKE